MGERGQHLNPILNKSHKPTDVRKVRNDKLHDIKIPITENIDYMLRFESKKGFNGSKTALSTDIFLHSLHHIIEYPLVEYSDQRLTTHIKINQKDYETLAIYSSGWKCSTRKAAHRIFMTAYLRKFGGVHL